MFHLSRKSKVFGFVMWITALICVIRFAVSATTVQTPPLQQSIPTTEKPKITVSGVSNISITEWDKSEISITGNATDKLTQDEIKVTQSNDNVDIVCHSHQPGKAISITLIVPTKAVVTIITDDGKIEIREPVKLTAIQLTDRIIDMNVPLDSRLDLQDVAFAHWYQPMGPDSYTTIPVGGKILGSGPPFLKLSKTREPVTINRAEATKVVGGPRVTASTSASGAASLTVSLPRRPLTIAAQTIALRGGLMGTSLRKSEPRLSNLKKEVSTGGAQKEDDQSDVTLRSQLINLNVSATDRNGRSVAGLKPEDFNIYEDGVRQTIEHFEPEQSPFNLVLLLDMSGSVETKRALIIEAALHFIEVIGPQDKVSIITFTTDVIVVSHLTQDRDDLRDSITNLVFPTGGTSFYDALGYSLVDELRKVRKQRNAIIVLTDGEDNALLYQNFDQSQTGQSAPSNPSPGSNPPQLTGSFLTFEQLLDGVRESDALIYPVHIDTSHPTPNGRQSNPPPNQQDAAGKISAVAKTQLQELADASGGRVYNAEQIEDIAKIYDQVAAEMRTVYSVAYVSTNTANDGKLRSIKVNINKPDVVARTRPGYYPR